jgi:cyclophilin family peptidyl-prolyl cis-trans isomerase
MRHRRTAVAPRLLDALEPRTLFASPTLATLPNVTVLSGAPMQIPLDGNDADAADALTFTVTSNNANVVATISPSINRSLKIVVNHASSGAGDTAISNETMILKLFEDKAPKTTARIIQLANAGFYNGLTFHRVINNFMIQGGDPKGDGTGGSNTTFDDEFDPSLQFTGRGLIAMAKSNDDTNDSQFFITESLPRYLDFNHTIFGQLVEGESTREKASNVLTDANDKPLSPVTMTSVTVVPDKQNGVLTLSVPNGVTSGTATITVTAKDPANNSVSKTFTVTIGPDTQDDVPFLGTIPNVTTTANTPTSVTIPAIDVDGGPQYFATGGDPNAFVHYAFDFSSGVKVNITPSGNFAGVVPLLVGVAPDAAGSSFDIQAVPVFINPAAPTSVDLLDASDTGTSSTDNLTRLNNLGGKTLQFQVNGVLPGATVKLFDGNTLIGQATVAAGQTSVVVTTNNTAQLSNGAHTITATQTLANTNWAVGNQSGTTDLASVKSGGLAINVDATAPGPASTPFFTWNTAAQSFTFQFTEDVSASLSGADLNISTIRTNPADQTRILAANIKLVWTAATKTAVFTLLNYPNGTLPDDNYTWTIDLAGVTDAAGNTLGTAPVFPFFSLAGDADKNRTVDFNDLVKLAQNYNITGGRTWIQGDFTGDGNVDFNDLVILAQRYNTTLPAPPASAPPVAAASSTAMSFDQAWATATAEPTRKAGSLFSLTRVTRPVKRK